MLDAVIKQKYVTMQKVHIPARENCKSKMAYNNEGEGDDEDNYQADFSKNYYLNRKRLPLADMKKRTEHQISFIDIDKGHSLS